MASGPPTAAIPLPGGVHTSYIDPPEHPLRFHTLISGSNASPNGLILLLHGFPEISFSYRKILPLLGAAGYHAVAYDQRGFGRTTGWDSSKPEDLRLLDLAGDAIAIVHALGYTTCECVIGHDFGAVGAGISATLRPDVFKRVVIMSHPLKGFPTPKTGQPQKDIHSDLAQLPVPRKHYKWYYSSVDEADHEMSPHQGLKEFIRNYYLVKSAEWKGNKPHQLESWTANELAKMPLYYIMPGASGMRDACASIMANEDSLAMEERMAAWLSDTDLAFYVQEYARTGFKGGLTWYNVQTSEKRKWETAVLQDRKLPVPCIFISGAQDWGMYQEPGALEAMKIYCTAFKGSKVIDDAGHWVQQEKPEAVAVEILDFLSSES
ncbi:hypothetical protein MMC25_001583 [Agyrium rufum]|nr:hypothetical protein [Agyrium rufum]